MEKKKNLREGGEDEQAKEILSKNARHLQKKTLNFKQDDDNIDGIGNLRYNKL